MRVRVRFIERHEYVALAIPFLEQFDPVRCTVLLTVADGIARGLIETCTLSVIEDVETRAIVGCASWTPPYMLLVSPMRISDGDDVASKTQEAAAIIAEAWVSRFGGGSEIAEIAGVVGPRDVAVPCAARFGELAHRGTTERMAERLFRLDAVIDPPPPKDGGTFRLARPDDVDLLTGWFDQFSVEANVVRNPNTEREIRNRIATGRLYVWQTTTTTSDPTPIPVSLVGHTFSIAGITRIGPVFTPPASRGRGFARALVAAVSQARLTAGDKACCLFTDLANPVSNAIYQQVGYRPVGDFTQIDLHAAS